MNNKYFYLFFYVTLNLGLKNRCLEQFFWKKCEYFNSQIGLR